MEADATQKSLAEASLITKVNNKGNKLNRVNDISEDIKIKFGEVEKVKVGYTNVRSLVRGTKREELEMLMQEQDIGILGLTETWGRSDIMDGEFDFPGFKLYRKDRSAVNDKKGGGVALYVRDNLLSVEYDKLNCKKCESIWCKIYIQIKTSTLLSGFVIEAKKQITVK